MPTRREVLTLPAAALAAAACSTDDRSVSRMPHTAATSRMPALFVSHGAPTLALDAASGADFTRMAAALPRPQAVLALSAHWLDAPATIGTRSTRELYYDFGGFAEELYRVTDEHFVPLLVALGAAADRPADVTFPIAGFELGSMSRLAVRFG